MKKWASFFDKYKYKEVSVVIIIHLYIKNLFLMPVQSSAFYGGYLLLGGPLMFLAALVAVYVGHLVIKGVRNFFMEPGEDTPEEEAQDNQGSDKKDQSE